MPSKSRPVKIVTDSAADIPAEIARALDITVIPLRVHIAGNTYLDGVTISGEAFYRELEATRSVTTTSLPSLDSFEEVYRRLTGEGNAVVSVQISSKLSGTFDTALMASTADGVAAEAVSVVDSRTVCMAQGWVAIKAAEAAGAGKSQREVAALAESLAPRAHIFGLLDTLEYVMRSGRVGRVPGAVGTLLSIKPILTTRPTGEAVILERVRSRNRALHRLGALTAALGPLEALAVMHGGDPEGAQELLELLKPLNPPEPVVVGHIGAVLGTHIGPRGVGICCLQKAP